ncbi:PIN domain-like protein, partial [Roridomyces roridus]
MGIPGLWKLLESSAHVMSFKELCLIEGPILEYRQTGSIIMGVDAGLWMTQCQTVFHKPHHAQMGSNPELRALLYKLVQLVQAGVVAVFVFDGPERPAVKRGKQVKTKPHWLVKGFIEMIEIFGFYHHQAPGEADAELAYLDRLQLIDGILTDDGDVALFGARRIIRKMNKANLDEITVYTSASMEEDPAVQLTQGGFLLLALMSGGDYNTVGVPGCGIGVAHALARCGFGDSLLEACNSPVIDLALFLPGWRKGIRKELVTNSRGYLQSRKLALARKIDSTFPDTSVLDLYTHPTTSWSPGFSIPAFDSWIIKVPDLANLAKYCHEKFGWSSNVIKTKFEKSLYPSLFVRRLTMPLDVHQQIQNHVVHGYVNDEQPQ